MASSGEPRVSAIQGFPPSSHRASAATGAVAVVLFVVSFVILGTDFPTYDDLPQKFALYYAVNGDDIELSNLLMLFGLASFAWFAGFLYWSYGVAEQVARGFQRATPIAFAGAVGGVAVALGYVACHEAALVSQGVAPPSVVRALDLMGAYALTSAAVLFSIFLLGSFFLIRVTNVLPSWLAYVAGVATVLGVIQAIVLLAPEDDDGVLGLLGFAWFALFLVWTLGSSIVLTRRTT
jgi:hypothetical protein